MLKVTNANKTCATFNGAAFSLAAPEDWESIGDSPTREAVQAWLAAGNTPVMYTVPVAPAPIVVTMRQARLALLGAGLLGAVTTAINALPEPQKSAALIEWEFSGTVERHRPFVLLLGPALGLDDLALDQLFVVAAAL